MAEQRGSTGEQRESMGEQEGETSFSAGPKRPQHSEPAMGHVKPLLGENIYLYPRCHGVIKNCG